MGSILLQNTRVTTFFNKCPLALCLDSNSQLDPQEGSSLYLKFVKLFSSTRHFSPSHECWFPCIAYSSPRAISSLPLSSARVTSSSSTLALSLRDTCYSLHHTNFKFNSSFYCLCSFRRNNFKIWFVIKSLCVNKIWSSKITRWRFVRG
jgi:hypothetical protein